jgi:quercetin dioxygenase-like cupin family protein
MWAISELEVWEIRDFDARMIDCTGNSEDIMRKRTLWIAAGLLLLSDRGDIPRLMDPPPPTLCWLHITDAVRNLSWVCEGGMESKMAALRLRFAVVFLAAFSFSGCGSAPAPEPAPASAPAPSEPALTLPTGFPERPFVRVQFDKLTWRPTEGNTLGVETAVVEGDPSKSGYYLTINHFPAGVMSRPHYHPDERYVLVLRGTWYTDEGEVFRPAQAVPLKPGDFMRHPKGGPHYDGALNEDTWVAISGYGPTNAKVIDGGELFGRSR